MSIAKFAMNRREIHRQIARNGPRAPKWARLGKDGIPQAKRGATIILEHQAAIPEPASFPEKKKSWVKRIFAKQKRG